MTTTAELLDQHDITDLVYRLGVCLDQGQFDEMRSLFVEHASACTPGGTAEGREALIAQARRNHRSEDRIQHVITNVLVDADSEQASVRANLVVSFAAASGTDESPLPPPVHYTLGEVYHFDAVRTPEGWRLSKVEATPVWMSGVRPLPRPAA